MKYTGKVHKFGANIDTDAIIPARYLVTTDAKELASHCMEGCDETFIKRAKKGDVIVAGKNFGCGSSREHAVLAIRGLGIPCVIAYSFARIFYRNSINMGFALFESPQASQDIKENDEVEVDADTGTIKNLTTGKIYKTAPYPDFIKDIIQKGGLMEWIKKTHD
ncbi:MAG: 3-isopropylmalate dehydratase small subunit [Candidatus Omnitrophota bacterium]